MKRKYSSLVLTVTFLFLFLLSLLFLSQSEAAVGAWSTEGPYGGYATSVAEYQGRLCAGTYGGGVFCSINGGNWTLVGGNKGLTTTAITALIFDATGNLYAGTDGGVFELASTPGNQWIAPASNAAFAARSSVVSFSFDGSGNLYAANSNSYNSSGEVLKLSLATTPPQWSAVGIIHDFTNALVFDNSKLMYAGTSSTGVFSIDTTDSAANWTPVTGGVDLTGYSVYSLAYAGTTAAGPMLIAGMFSGSYSYLVNDPNPAWVKNSILGLSSTITKALLVTGTTPTLIAGVDDGIIYELPIGASTWQPVVSGQPASTGSITSLISSTDGMTLYSGTSGNGVFSIPLPIPVPSGTSWASVANNTGFVGTSIGSLVLDSKGSLNAWTNNSFANLPVGGVWTVPVSSQSPYLFSMTIDSSGNFYGTDSNKIYQSTDGITWNPLTTNGLSNPYISTFIIGSNGENNGIIYLANYNNYKIYTLNSKDPNSAWIDLGQTVSGLPGNPYGVSHFAFNSQGALYAGMENGRVYSLQPSGTKWQNMNMPTGNGFLYVLAFDAKDTLCMWEPIRKCLPFHPQGLGETCRHLMA